VYARREYYASRGMGDGAFAGARKRAAGLVEQADRPIHRVLDFGAGEGHLVAAFRSLGLVAEGVEPSEAGRQQAMSRYGIELAPSLPPETYERYDLIVLQHALEHVADPIAVLRELAGRLDTLGSMLIEVPNASSFEMLRPSRRRTILDLPVHLYHFTPRTLSAALSAAGLEIVRMSLTNPDWLEWLFALRASRRHPAAELKASLQHDVRPHSVTDQLSLRRAWRERLLPAIRRWCPGWSFHAVARKTAVTSESSSRA
jgi:2-polyprenyl-3-methyl-5-hydroxy-6-metoxy-1,4-benzoquinol methylase